MWWKAILFCLMTDGPASSKLDLTLIIVRDTTALIDQLEKDRPQISIGSLHQFTSVCNALRHVFRINRNLDVRLPIDIAENLDGSPEFGSWKRLLAGHLTSQITSLLRMKEVSLFMCMSKVATPNAT